MLIRIPISFPPLTGRAGARRSSNKRGPLVTERRVWRNARPSWSAPWPMSNDSWPGRTAISASRRTPLGSSPLEADPRAASADALATRLTERLPRVELSDLLMEVDTWTYFSRRFPCGRRGPLRPTLLPHFYGSVLAYACNFGVEQMAHLTDLAADHLAWCTTWFLREDTLKAACTSLVNYHHQLPVSQAWGSGVLSSSDGQRFPVSGTTRHARRMPPSLGYGMGVTFYSWSSDQLSQYGTKFVPVTVRDSTYVLDEICNNETELPIREHTTDTAGATEIIFALFDLLGFRFAPRLRDLNDRRLFASGPMNMQRYPRLQPHVAGRIHRPRILHWWDEMLRAAGSMKLGWVTASLLVQKLQAHPQQNALAAALQEYGRLARTLHIMHWYGHTEDRRRFLRQLNKGEALHDLRAALVIANKGQLRQRRGEALTHQALCLNLVTNAVIVWNTVYMAAAVEQLKHEGVPVHEGELAHVWPTRYAHIMASTASTSRKPMPARAYGRSNAHGDCTAPKISPFHRKSQILC